MNTNKRANSEYAITYYRSWCALSNTPKSNTTDIPRCHSLKFNCGWYIIAAQPMLDDSSRQHPTIAEIVGLALEHTNGCEGNNVDMNHAINKCAGRQYPDAALIFKRKSRLDDTQPMMFRAGCLITGSLILLSRRLQICGTDWWRIFQSSVETFQIEKSKEPLMNTSTIQIFLRRSLCVVWRALITFG